MPKQRLPVFDAFIASLRAVWASEMNDEHRMRRAKPLLEALLISEELKAHSVHWPSTEGYKNLRLYVDPDYHFVFNAVVRAPNRMGGVHDHAECSTAFWREASGLSGTNALTMVPAPVTPKSACGQ